MHYKQSDKWARYLETQGWDTDKIGGVNIYTRKVPLIGRLGKAQRIVVEKNQKIKILEEIDRLMERKRVFSFVIEPEIPNNSKKMEELLTEHGYKKGASPLTPPKTLIIDLNQPEEQLRSNLHTLAKRMLKRSKRFRIRTTSFHYPIPQRELKNFWRLSRATGKRHRCYVESLKQLQYETEALGKDAYLIITTTYDHEPTAGIFMITHDNAAYYHHAASSKLAYHTGSSYHCAWEAIKLAQRQGNKTFDFEGIYDKRYPRYSRGWEGLTQFKNKFEGREVIYPKAWRKIKIL